MHHRTLEQGCRFERGKCTGFLVSRTQRAPVPMQTLPAPIGHPSDDPKGGLHALWFRSGVNQNRVKMKTSRQHTMEERLTEFRDG